MPRYYAADINVRLATTAVAGSTLPQISINDDIVRLNIDTAHQALADGRVLPEEDVPCLGDDYRTHFISGTPFLFVKTCPAQLNNIVTPSTKQGDRVSGTAQMPSKHVAQLSWGSSESPLTSLESTPTSPSQAEPPQQAASDVTTDNYTNPSLTSAGRQTNDANGAIHVVVDFCHKTALRTFERTSKCEGLKFDVFFNGELSASNFVPAHSITMTRRHQVIFSGRRCGRFVERTWLLEGSKPRTTPVGALTANKDRADMDVLQRWTCLSEALLNEANAFGRTSKHTRPPVAEYLEGLAMMEAPPDILQWQHPGGKGYGIIDVVVSLGKGSKDSVSSGYCTEPRRARNPDCVLFDGPSTKVHTPARPDNENLAGQGSNDQLPSSSGLHFNFAQPHTPVIRQHLERDPPYQLSTACQQHQQLPVVEESCDPSRLFITDVAANANAYATAYHETPKAARLSLAPFCELGLTTLPVQSFPEENSLTTVSPDIKAPTSTMIPPPIWEIKTVTMSLGSAKPFLSRQLQTPYILPAVSLPSKTRVFDLRRRSSQASNLSLHQRVGRSPHSPKHSDSIAMLQQSPTNTRMDLSWATQDYLDRNKIPTEATSSFPVAADKSGGTPSTSSLGEEKPRKPKSMRSALEKELRALGVPTRGSHILNADDKGTSAQIPEKAPFKTPSAQLRSRPSDDQLMEPGVRKQTGTMENIGPSTASQNNKHDGNTKGEALRAVKNDHQNSTGVPQCSSSSTSDVHADLDSKALGSSQVGSMDLKSKKSAQRETDVTPRSTSQSPERRAAKRRRFPDAIIAAELMSSLDLGMSTTAKPRPRPSYGSIEPGLHTSTTDKTPTRAENDGFEDQSAPPTSLQSHSTIRSSKPGTADRAIPPVRIKLGSGTGQSQPRATPVASEGQSSSRTPCPTLRAPSESHRSRRKSKSAEGNDVKITPYPMPKLCENSILTYAKEGEMWPAGGQFGFRQIKSERTGQFQESEVLLGVRFLVVDN